MRTYIESLCEWCGTAAAGTAGPDVSATTRPPVCRRRQNVGILIVTCVISCIIAHEAHNIVASVYQTSYWAT